MPVYSVYGLTIDSVFHVPALPRVNSDDRPIDVRVERGTVEAVSESKDRERPFRVRADSDRCRLTYADLGTFLVKDGERVVFDSEVSDASETDFFRHLLKSPILGVVHFQRGQLVLHASAIAVDDQAGVFLGPRGAGKSTTAAAFYANGYDVLEDDVVVIKIIDGTPFVIPGVPQMRLLPDTVEGLDLSEVALDDTELEAEKYQLALERNAEPVPLSGCYLLRTGEEVDLKPVTGQEQLLQLVSQTYAKGLLSDTGMSAVHFDQCSTIVSTTPFQYLFRPEDFDQMNTIVDSVSKDLNSK